MKKVLWPFLGLSLVALASCQHWFDFREENHPHHTKVNFKNYSETPPLIKKLDGFEGVKVYTLISSADHFSLTPDFTFGGSADGSGLLRVSEGYSYIVNNEDNFSVARIALDKTFKPVGGEYILNSDGGQWRLCSATLATPAEHGFGPVYLTCGESGPESRTHGLDPFAPSSSASTSRELAGFGRWSAENAVPLPKTAFPGKTVVIIGDDDSGSDGGQVAMYLANTKGDLDNGSLYILRTADQNPREKDIVEGSPVAVEFAKIEDHKTLTGAQINAAATALNGIAFGRVEDVDYRKSGGGREIYFNVTGQSGNDDRTKYGRVYKLVLDHNNPLKGILEVVLDGDNKTGKAKEFQDPDGILVTKNYAYIGEDPNGYGDETHDAYLYQYNLNTKELKKVFELNHFRDDPGGLGAEYGSGSLGSWEYGSMIDISETVNEDNSFLLCIQPHGWKKPEFAGVDGGSLRTNENQGSEVVIVKGLPR